MLVPALSDADVIAATAALGMLGGLLGAWRNEVRFHDERALWAIGGAVGASVAMFAGAWLRPDSGAILGVAAWSFLSFLSSMWLPYFDHEDRTPQSILSFMVKGLQSPVLTGLGGIVAGALALAGRRVVLTRGTLFVNCGPGRSAVTLGAIVWIRRGLWSDDGRIAAGWARHEAFHTRAVGSLGESGFYLTYLLIGAPLALLRGAPWNALDRAGVGQPFERTAYALDHDEPPSPALDDLRSPTA